jgi:hypothetical protein
MEVPAEDERFVRALRAVFLQIANAMAAQLREFASRLERDHQALPRDHAAKLRRRACRRTILKRHEREHRRV